VFSRRLPPDLVPNQLANALARLRAEGRPIIDLTESNPTRAGFSYPDDLLASLAEPRGVVYAPHALGLPPARRAVADDYGRRGIQIDPARIALTASTSEAYALLFKILCDPGDEVLIPRPSYPLFEHLTRLEGVSARSYGLDYEGSWAVDVGSIERAWSPRTRAVVTVHPNNPTGSYVRAGELDRIAALCASRDAALVADEVFADYPLKPTAAESAGRMLDRRDALVFSLGGLSKSVGLPQVKLGWVAMAGPDALVHAAIDRLEVVCDAYLSVSTPVQLAAAELLGRGAVVRRQIQNRVVGNLCQLVDLTGRVPASRVLDVEGGWYAVLHVPSIGTEEDLVLDLLTTDGVLVHPGYFFDFPRESYLIVSLLPSPDVFADGIGRVLRHLDCKMLTA
jgi:hypothetical protein